MKYTPWAQFSSLVAGTTQRVEGYSKAPFDSFNMALQVGDDEAAVKMNREDFIKNLDIKSNQVIFTHQSHSTVIRKVSREDGGRGWTSFENGIEADALYTFDTDLYLAIYHADCVPVFFYAPSRGLIGIIHAGRQGTLKQVTALTIAKLMDDEGLTPDELFFHLGPSISFSHEIITEEEAKRIAAMSSQFRQGVKATGGVYFLDTALINFLELRKLNVPVNHISSSFACTYEDSDLYFSARRDHPTGRMVSFIARNK